MLSAVCPTQYQSSLYSYFSLPDLLASLPLDFSYYVMAEAIAYRKYSYTLLLPGRQVLTFGNLRTGKRHQVHCHACAHTHARTHARAQAHAHTHTPTILQYSTYCITLSNHLSLFVMSDKLFALTVLTDTNMLNSVDFVQERLECKRVLFYLQLGHDLSTLV